MVVPRRRAVCGVMLLPVLAAGLARAQARAWRVGLIHVGDDHMPPSYQSMQEGMRALGYEEGRNIRYDFRNVKDDAAALDAAQRFVREKVDLIVAFDNEACAAARKATSSRPIVMIHAANPVAGGFAVSLARPGRNMTGFAGRAELPAKELEILREIAPRFTRVLLLFDSTDPSSLGWRDEARLAARKLGFILIERDAFELTQIRPIFERLARGEAEAVVFASNPVRHRHQKPVLEMATAKGMVMIGSRRDVVEAGALLSYSYDFGKVGAAAARRYVDPVLKGANPGELPIEEVTEYELVVNRGVAKRFGLTIPQAVLLRAERVID
ncbi:MAG: ABC transporter substrate-binding protein [Burkholderiales bacterium]|nr:ABC transporter substrate-binding protein [Burkholderiales bacterium]